ncbi:MAG: insulinase family protein [Gemmatimonadetes bacterium]|nr:insulinase family protein [Gemmatimonadota bacterium]
MKRTLGALAAALVAVSPVQAGKGSVALDDLVQEFHLDNGLTLLVVENHESPTIGLATAFSVGSAEERPGVGGVSHILEHMLFKGTTEVGTSDWEAEKVHHDRLEELTYEIKTEKAKGRRADQERIDALLAERREHQEAAKQYSQDNQFDGLYTEAGAVNTNAFTSYDITAYIMALPANRLDLWMYLESERLRDPVLRQYYTEVQNVMEERRLRTDADPDGKLQENFLSVAFDAHWYGYPIIGWPSDIETVTRTEAEEWFKIYYAPNRMTLSIVGDVDAEEVYEQVKEYFGDIPRQDPPEMMETFDIERKGERRIEVEYDAEPALVMGWHKVNVPHPDDAALQIVSEVLSGGRSSRLIKRLVEERQIAASVNTDHEYPGVRWNNLFFIEGKPRAPHTNGDLEAAIWEELNLLKRDGITERELEKAKNRVRASQIRQLESNFGLSIQLAYAQAAFDDWRIMDEAAAATEAVTREDVLRVARATFKKNRTTVAMLVEPAFEPDPEKEAKGREIVARMVKALGGEKALAGVKTSVVSSDVSLSVQGQTMTAQSSSSYALPDRMRSDFTIFGQSTTQCLAPDDSWSLRGGQAVDMEGDDLKDARAGLERDLFLFAYPAVASSFVLQAQPAVDGMDVVEVRGATGKSFLAFFDPATGLPAKFQYDSTHPMTGAAAEFSEVFSDFRAVNGIKRPHVTETLIDGTGFAESTVSSATFNTDISDDQFVRPTG